LSLHSKRIVMGIPAAVFKAECLVWVPGQFDERNGVLG
jgi:hypothetical protein